MTTERDLGGSAFPIHGSIREFSGVGMTLRDYFAAKALPAYFSDGLGHDNFERAAEWAYEMADAMLKERLK